jgi:membrane protein
MFNRLTQALPWLRRHIRPLDTVLSVHERVGAVGGGAYSSALALAALLSLFPLMLVLIAIVGYFSVSDVNLAQETVDRLGLTGDAADTMLRAFGTAEDTRRTATIVGVLGLLWAGLGVVDAASAMVNTVWQVTGRGIVGKLHELAWLAGAGTLFLVSIASGSLTHVVPGPAVVPTAVLGFVLDTLLCLWTFRALVNLSVPWRAHLPGALVGGVGLTVLKLIGSFYVPRIVETSSALYGSIGVIFAVLAWFVLGSKVLMYATAYNVLRHERGHGTVEASIEVPRIEGEVPSRVTRGGAVAESEPSPEDLDDGVDEEAGEPADDRAVDPDELEVGTEEKLEA